MIISNIVLSWLYIIPLIPSVIVCIFVLYHLLIDRALRTALNNHIIIVLLSSGLIESVTDGVWYVSWYRTGTVLSPTPAFCTIWSIIDSALYVSIHIQMAWASIERHILIFNPNWFGSRRKRFFFHYLPSVVCIVYPIIFYFIMFMIPCDVPLNYRGKHCGRYTCISNLYGVSVWDGIGNYISPPFVIVIFSVALFVRVVYSRYRVRRQIEWRNYKKLTLQLLPLSILYTALQFPPMIMYTAYSIGLNYSIGFSYYIDTVSLTFWVILFTPFACIVSLPDLEAKCKKVIFFWRRNPAVGPQPRSITRPNVGQMRAAVANVA
jgi:hypothetical protein